MTGFGARLNATRRHETDLFNQPVSILPTTRSLHPAAPAIVDVSHTSTLAEAAAMSDADLFDAARTAARTHDSALAGPLIEEMARRRFDVDKVLEVTTILWPPAWTNLRMKTRGVR